MGYKNSINVLPAELIAQIQLYIDGEYLYIPRRSEKRRNWGDSTGYRQNLQARNLEIARKYNSGISVRKLSEEYFLSPQGIYRILSKHNS